MTTKLEEKKPEYKNDLVQFVIHRKPNCIVEYEVEVSRPICFEAHKKAAKAIGKEVIVPGFRKGKAPPEVVAKRYPHDLDKQWQEAIATSTYKECAQLANIPVVSPDAQITFKMIHHNPDSAKLILYFETVPSIPSIDPAKCVLEEVKRPEVSKEKVDETIRQSQMFFGNWQILENRPIQEGDFILVDVDVLEQDPPQRLFTNTRFEVSEKSMAQWMIKLVLGKNVGGVLEGISQPDSSLSEEEKKEFPPKKARITIKALEQVVLPPLNDEFAKQLGIETVEALQNRIEALLNKKADEHVREKKREQVTQFLLSYHFELPPSIVEKETKFRLEQMIKDPQFKANWDKSSDHEKRQLIDNVKEQAEKAVKIFYLCRKIAADQNMAVTAKDFPLPSTDQVEMLLFPNANRHDPRQPDVKQAEVYSQVLLEKTEDWIIAHARMASKKAVKEQVAPPKNSEKSEEIDSSKETNQEKPKRKGSAKEKKEG